MAEDYQRLTEGMELSSCECRERDALRAAIDATKGLPDGERRLDLVAGIYWSGRKRTMEEVAGRIGVTVTAARKWHREFIQQVGVGLGFSLDVPPKKRAKNGRKT